MQDWEMWEIQKCMEHRKYTLHIYNSHQQMWHYKNVYVTDKGHPPIPRRTWGNFEETRGGWGKVACWSTKAAISLKRVKIEERLLSRAYRNSPTLFRMVPSLNHYDLLFPMIGGSQLPPKLQSLLSHRNGWSDGPQNWPEHSQDPSRQKPIKSLEKREHGRIQGLPNLFGYFLLSH